MPTVLPEPTLTFTLTDGSTSIPSTAGGGEQFAEFSVESSDGTCHVDGDTVPDWLSVSVLFGWADEEVEITVRMFVMSRNYDSPFGRRANVGFYNDAGAEHTVSNIIQRGSTSSWSGFSVSPDTVAAPPEGGYTDYVQVTASTEVHVDGDTVPSWAAPEWSADGLQLRLSVGANTTGGSREASIGLYDDNEGLAILTVTQEAYDSPEPEPDATFRVLYAGEFPDIRGNTWRCEILRNTTEEPPAGELEFPADQPLVIEWPSINFEDVMWGSSATLRVVSPGDRTYIDLYTIEPGNVRLDVYRDGSLYWSGMLDPEFYEEPYERLSGYEVALTFTDFGILDRLKYDLEGVQAVRDIINDAVERSGLNHTRKNVTNKFAYGWTGIRFGVDRLAQESDLFETTTGIAVNSENFTDEEGEVMSVAEVLEGVLQPLGLKMVQRDGTISLFDPTGLRESFEDDGGDVPSVTWAGDSQTLGVDRVYNSVTVTFSPYVQTTLLEDCISFDAVYREFPINTTPYGSDDTSDPKYWTYRRSDSGTDNDYDFTFLVSGQGSGATFGNDAPLSQYFHILPIYGSADECSGIPYFFTQFGDLLDTYGRVPRHSALRQEERWFTLPRIHIPAVSSSYFIRFVVELLVDCRYDPFSGETDNNHNDTQTDLLEKNSAFVFLPAFVTLYDSQTGGTAICHYVNNIGAYGGYRDRMTGEYTWSEGAAQFGDCWLEWYNESDLTDNSGGVGGWKGNRHCIGMPDGGTSDSHRQTATVPTAQLMHCDDGEYMPFPPEGGWLEIALGDDFAGFKYGSGHSLDDLDCGDSWGDAGVNSNIRWCLLRNPSVSVVRNNLKFDDADLDDVEYRGTLNAAAQDDLGIDTVCGTADGAPPTARGLYSRLYYDTQPTEMYRDGATGRPEELLINQLYKQYAGRRAVITGEAEIPGSLLLTERNQEGATFILTADSEDVRMGVSDIEIRELGEDTYTPQ